MTTIDENAVQTVIDSFKKYASHKPGQEVSFFRYLASRSLKCSDKASRSPKCADNGIWGTVADAIEILEAAKP